jgi:DNA helicase-2/ATP-dependent DNA helicase PcrA
LEPAALPDPLKRTFEPAEPPAPAPGGIAARARVAAGGGASYLAGLNAEQRLAVETLDGPVLVLAGAGTGKTRVLTVRIAHILATGRARPSEILAVTFTNKAAREMKGRVGDIVGHVVEGMPWLGTFHSIGVKILRRHAEMVGLKSDFTILDVDDQIRLLKQLLEAENIDDKRWPARVLAMLIDGWKNRGLTPEQVPPGETSAFANGKGLKLYKAFQERLKILNACDFGDLLLECIRLFREQPEVLRQYQARFKFILVDEYQDTNVAQYLWLRLLAQRTQNTSPRARGEVDARSAADEGAPELPELMAPGAEPPSAPPHPNPLPARGEREAQAPKNICCVGDDDQSIYGWRGAEVDNILRFEHDFPGATVIRLERNYRSTGHILAAASHLIAHNEGRLGKTLRTDDELGEKVSVTGAWDSEEEARAIGEEIEQLQRADESGKPHALNDIAILVRASFQMREFEDRFVTLGLNYRVIGGPRFYERAEIRDALAYLRVVNSPADDLAFERIVNVPKRGLGDATVQLLHDHARKRRVPLTVAARAMVETDELKPKPRGSLRGVLDSFERWRKQRDALPHTELAEIILDESGYTEMWQKDRSADAAGRLENLKELVRSMDEFENLQGFLEHISLVMDNEKGADADAVNIMTLHAAKGLEFDTVFLPGWEACFPTSARSTIRAAPASRKSAGSVMSASPARNAAPRSISPPIGACTACGRPTFRRAFSTSCRRPMSRSPSRRPAPASAAMRATAPRASTAPPRSAQATTRRAGSARRQRNPTTVFPRMTRATSRTTTKTTCPPFPGREEGDRATRPPKPAGRRRTPDRLGVHGIPAPRRASPSPSKAN